MVYFAWEYKFYFGTINTLTSNSFYATIDVLDSILYFIPFFPFLPFPSFIPSFLHLPLCHHNYWPSLQFLSFHSATLLFLTLFFPLQSLAFGKCSSQANITQIFSTYNGASDGYNKKLLLTLGSFVNLPRVNPLIPSANQQIKHMFTCGFIVI